ncbi:BglG family transcription antiterminator [Aquibacillus sp. 3ASR75-11]|uniref:BglG family transcription antiterminator n=1 Tax=Terrihalobacillus insolitus TaxID=2950438 RepID=A0A9X4AKY2_9BACI|nr:BglG family transcription antiterminator [Terrihalobacillus insolitus]MDC3412006.1 BglG family transcription antiterminator [Terrihalobacillus insolitus]MDC3423309.1 BglG family transcription antiterminator [Terrihalobacillus insolitus]
MYISGRERKLLELLLLAQDEVTMKDLADTLEVSTRTVHRDLKHVEEILNTYNLTLHKKSGVGIHISGTDQNKENLEVELFHVTHTDYTQEERQAIILMTLLESNEPIKLFSLASELQVTIATISNDLDKMEEQIKDDHLTLIRKRGYGVKIEGKEENKRATLSNLITQYVDEYDFISMVRENIQKKSKQQFDTISNRLLGLVDPAKLHVIEKRVEHIRKQLPYGLADSAHIGLVVHLALAVERLQQGELIHFDQEYLEQIKETKEYELAERLVHDLETTLKMNIPSDEIGYITMHLMGAKLRFDRHYHIEDSSLNIAYKAKELISYIGEHLGEDLSHQDQLLNDLVGHLKPTIYRLKQNMKIKNPMIDDIIKDYHDLFSLIEDGVHRLFPEITFPKEEIGFLVLHFAAALMQEEEQLELKALVVCSSGIGTAKMLATRLMQKIPEIKEVDKQSLFDLEQTDVSNYDIVVSTIPLKEIEKEYMLTSPVLTPSEIKNIQLMIKRIKVNKRMGRKQQIHAEQPKKTEQSSDTIGQLQTIRNYSNVIWDLIDGFCVLEIKDKKPIEHILSVACDQLEKEEVLSDKAEVFEKLIKREKMGGLGIPNTKLALYHTRSNSIRKPTFQIYRLAHPVPVQGMDNQQVSIDHVLLMLAAEQTDQEVLEVLSFLSGLIIREQDVFQSGDENEIRQFLSYHLQQFLNEKLSYLEKG